MSNVKKESQVPFSSGCLVGTDALGRVLPGHSQAGSPRHDRYVGIFYFLWTGQHGTSGPYDITKILAQDPNAVNDSDHPLWGPMQAFHFWGEPLYGYYFADDAWVLRRHVQMLTSAGVDFLVFDATNRATYKKVYDVLFSVLDEVRLQGWNVPKFVFYTNTQSGQTVTELYQDIYKPGNYPDLWFYWEDKPLSFGNQNDAVLRPEVKQFFTIKYSWAWTDAVNNPNHWQWIDEHPQNWGWSSDPSKADQLPVAKASHPTNNRGESYQNNTQPAFDQYKLTPYTGQGRHFTEQWGRVFEVNPGVVMITQWNEWLAQRFEGTSTSRPGFLGHQVEIGETYFVDLYNQEYNRDIEPMKDGHTDNHYYLMLGNIRKFK